MTHDYSTFYSTVAVLVPVFLFVLYVGRDRLYRGQVVRLEPTVPDLFRGLGRLTMAAIALFAALTAELGSLFALYEPSDATPTVRFIVFFTALVLVLEVLIQLADGLARGVRFDDESKSR